MQAHVGRNKEIAKRNRGKKFSQYVSGIRQYSQHKSCHSHSFALFNRFPPLSSLIPFSFGVKAALTLSHI